MTTNSTANRIWGLVMTVLIALVGGSVYLVFEHEQQNIAETTVANHRELRLLATLVINDLRTGNYQRANEVLLEWGKENPDVVSLSLVAANEYRFSDYRRSGQVNRTQTLDLKIDYSYKGSALLTLTKDLSAIAVHKRELITQLGVAIALLALLIGVLARSVLTSRFDANLLRQHTEELERERARAQLYLETVEAIIIALDSSGRIELINRKGCQVLGYRQDELIGESWFVTCLPQPEGYDQEYPYFLEILSGDAKSVEYYENTIVTRDGKFRQVAWHNSLIYDEEGAIVGTMSAGEDITERLKAEKERKSLQKQLLNAQKLESLNLEKKIAERTEELVKARTTADEASAAKSEFLAKMSHELRTPLNAIIGLSEQKHEDAIEFGDEAYIEPLFRVHRAGEHLLDLINDILDISKIEAGKMELNFESVEINSLVEDVLSSAIILAEKNGNRLECDCSPDIGNMETDLTRIRQVLLNILSNACKFTKRGEIRISITREQYDESDWIWYSVTDTGIGMATEEIGQLFQDFTQFDTKVSRAGGSTGLGLSISKKIVDMMGGTIDVVSTLGEGSTFTLKVPAAMEKTANSLFS